jgi:hypothetical protein
VINVDLNTLSIQTNSSTTGSQVRIIDGSTKFSNGRVISTSKISNDYLITEDPYGKGPYGTPIKSNTDVGESTTQNIEQFFRSQVDEFDVDTFYIVEGVLKSKNNNQLLSLNDKKDLANNGNSSKGGGGPSYTILNFPRVFPKFSKLLVKIIVKLFPKIEQFLSLISNPAEFIIDIIVSKLGDDFGNDIASFEFFSKEFLQNLNKLNDYINNLKQYLPNSDKYNEAKESLQNYLNSTLLKNYIYVSPKGEPKFLLDGSSVISLFGEAPILKDLPGVTFGIESNLSSLATSSPQTPLKLIFSLGQNIKNNSKSLDDLKSSLKNGQDTSLLKNSNPSLDSLLNDKNVLNSISNSNQISVKYSTGEFISGVDYTYIFLSEKIESLLSDVNALELIGDKQSLSKAISKLDEASRIDPSNQFIKDKISELKKISDLFHSNPIFDFILSLVTLPLKVVVGIVSYILDFFKSLVNPLQILPKLLEFLTFKWILDFFDPISQNGILALSSFKFDIKKYYTEWIPAISIPTLDPKEIKFDMNEIIGLPWTKWPVYSLDEFKSISKSPLPLSILKSFLCFIESIINSFIDFIWSTLGLLKPSSGDFNILKPPYLKLCNLINVNMTPKEISDALNGSKKKESDSLKQEKNPSIYDTQNDVLSSFIYDIRLPDGTNIRDLDQESLNKFIDENKNLQFDFT